MFNKPKTNAPADPTKPKSDVPIPALPDLPSPGRSSSAPAASAPTPSPALTPAHGGSVLGRDIVFEGNISGQGDLTIDGQVRGDVRVGRLIVGDTGSVDGSVQAENVEVRGRVVGAVTGQQVRLLGTAYVDGDINHEQLAIEVGAYFQGRCLQTRPGQSAPTAPASAPKAAPAPTVSSGPDAASQAEVVSLKPTA